MSNIIDTVRDEAARLAMEWQQAQATITRLKEELVAAQGVASALELQIKQAQAMLAAAEKTGAPRAKAKAPAERKPPPNKVLINQTGLRDFMRQHVGERFTDAELIKAAFGVTSVSDDYRNARNALVEAGIVQVEKVPSRTDGKGGKPKKLYYYEKPTHAGPGNPPPPPDPLGEAISGVGRGAPVPGTGNGRAPGGLPKDVQQLLKPALGSGWSLEPTANQHFQLVKGLRRITLSGSTSDINAVNQIRRQLKRERIPM